jgi:glutamate synthase domain-containing protein 2/glutamate synthase domain-containing protein 1/glutamate synthase domain-containing protein 3/ferredoxin
MFSRSANLARIATRQASYNRHTLQIPPGLYSLVRFNSNETRSRPLRIRTQVNLNNMSIEAMVKALTPAQLKCLPIIFTGSMSYGSMGDKAHEAIAEAVNRIAMTLNNVASVQELKKLPHFIGPMSKSGEGGELRHRNNTAKQSLGRQVASGRFGVNGEYLGESLSLEIKINQGAKPGIGGELPGVKVTALIAEARLTTPGVTLASPPPHHDIYSIEDLKQLIRDLRSANPIARISVKLAASKNIGIIAAGCVKCGADEINIAGPGGTGATPTTAKYEFVHPWEMALAEVHQTLTAEGLRDSVKLTVSGGIQTGLDAFKALLLGANWLEIGTSALISLGCIMAEICETGKCPAGIATTDPIYMDKFKGTPEDLARSLLQMAISLSDYLEEYGLDPSQAVGRTDLLQVKKNSPLTGLEKLLFQPKNPYLSGKKIIKNPGSSYAEQKIIWDIIAGNSAFDVEATNQILSFGARIGYHALKDEMFRDKYYKKPVVIRFKGLACGQSFGFVAPANLTLIAENANDGTGKSLDGGTIYIKNLAGNVTGFGATRGKIFVKKTGGRAGTRNSGADIVTEQLDADGAGFMTGGSFTVIGDPGCYPGLSVPGYKQTPSLVQKDLIGPNFGSGFSGGSIFLPTALYHQMKKKQHIAPSALAIKAQSLDDTDITNLSNRLREYRKEINSEIVDALLGLDKETLASYFTKLDARPSPVISLTETQNTEIPETLAVSNILDTFELAPEDKSPSPTPTESLAKSTIKDSCGTGFLMNRDGESTHELVNQSLTMLERFSHRGATSIDPETGDGCGIRFYGLHRFFQKQFPNLQIEKDNYSILHIALPKNREERYKALALLRELLVQEGLDIAGEREVPVNRQVLGYLGQQDEPALFQFVIPKQNSTPDDFDKQLIRARLRFEFNVHKKDYSIRPHIISNSPDGGVIYKAMCREEKFGDYFIDLKDPDFEASAAADHSRFSTNTKPRFINCQMFPNLGNNGENNALQQIIHQLTHDPGLKNLLKVKDIDLDGYSDSHIMSIFLDYLCLLGYTPEEIVNLTIHKSDPQQNQSSYLYNLFGVPFEGPNATIMTIGKKVIILRDPNGFRPASGVYNQKQFYCGSELGTVDIEGEVFALSPAQPLVIDLLTGSITPLKSQPLEKVHLQTLDFAMQSATSHNTFSFSDEELALRKYRAGWNEELDDRVMQPLLREGKDKIVSMGDHRPTEALVTGTHFDLGAFFKGDISQVTNPPLDSKREKSAMSARTFIGEKPALAQVGKQSAAGLLASSPIINNQQMAFLMTSNSLKAHALKSIFPVNNHETGLKESIDIICQEAIDQVQKGVTLLILSDLASDEHHAAIPPVILASFVHEALLKAGMRRKVCLALQSGSILSGRDVAQAISIGGADIINPYLPFIPDKEARQNPDEFKQRCKTYQEALCNELFNFMARVGISTVTAYRGTKAFNAYGVDPELAKQLGLHSDLGGVGLTEIATMTINQHNQPNPKGLGRLDPESDARLKIWDAHNTRAQIERARGKRDNSVEERMDLLKIGSPRGQFFLKAPQIWNKTNPMTICILGGGAAGFYQAQSLLDSELPIQLIIIEKNIVNPIGLVGNGVAPDHVGTKNQAKILRAILDDPRVLYFGGIEVGNVVSMQALKSIYPCIIDCRGAPVSSKLNVPGEASDFVVPAGKVYQSYNNAFNPLQSDVPPWPFFSSSKNSELGIIGNGNVAADIARIFLKSPEELGKTRINPRFLYQLKSNGPSCVRIFARGGPDQTKMSFSELQQLMDLPNVGLSATFDDSQINTELLSSEQKVLYDFFSRIKDKKFPLTCSKRLHFHFNTTTKSFNEINQQEIEAIFIGQNREEYRCRARAFITAIGHLPMSDHEFDDKQVYGTGWVLRKGGKLSTAEKSAEETTAKIKRNFLDKKFNHTLPPAKEQPWQLTSAVGNAELMNILNYQDAGYPLETIEDYRAARRYQQVDLSKKPSEPIKETKPDSQSNAPCADKEKVIIYDPLSQQSVSYDASGDKTLLETLSADGLAPPCQCGGEMKCGECTVTAINNPSAAGKKEQTLIEVNGGDPEKLVLACARQMRGLGGGVFFAPKRIDRSPVDGNHKPRSVM